MINIFINKYADNENYLLYIKTVNFTSCFDNDTLNENKHMTYFTIY